VLRRTAYLDLIRRTALRHGKMAFISGPRQVGKTTLARQLLPGGRAAAYFTWDDPEFRRAWVRDPKVLIPVTRSRRWVVLDELHKAPRWKTQLKGLYDTRGSHAHVIVTGSARLDLFRRGGDSLLGRYFAYRLHPLSVGELGVGRPVAPDDVAAAILRRHDGDAATLHALLERGGFPEPFLSKDDAFVRLWRRTRTERLVREDLRDLTRAQELSLIETTALLLPERVGSPFSLQSLAEDLEVSHPTLRRWLGWLVDLYYAFVVPPFARRVARSLRKRPKVYLWDWSEVPAPGPRFENLVASHLLKAVHFWTDAGVGTFELYYVRDKDQREVDFLVVRDRVPWLLLEARAGEGPASPHLAHFAAALRPAVVAQVVGCPGIHERFALGAHEQGLLVSADDFFRNLP
jgi:uncharacterized protein